MIQCTLICDSINPQSTRLITMLFRYPKFLHQETLRHRTLYIHDCLYDPDFSFSVSSARAIPFKKLLEEVRSDELRAAPLVWGAEQKGMSPGNELSDELMPDPYIDLNGKPISIRQVVKNVWKRAALDAANRAEQMDKLGVHKSITNRIIEPYIHVNCLTTGTTRGWMNFFGLRLDSAADPTLQILAKSAWKVWNESQPKFLKPGQWHLPYIDENVDEGQISDNIELPGLIKISAARCARLSYLSFSTNKRSTIEEDLELYNKLVGGEIIHASPLEHQATPDSKQMKGDNYNDWMHPDQSGNLELGWRQYRKFLPNESIALLPSQYQ